MEKFKLELENFGGILYIVFLDEFGTPTDEQIAQYLNIDVNVYKDMLVKFGCWTKPHGFKCTFFVSLKDADKALEWVQSIEMANMLRR